MRYIAFAGKFGFALNWSTTFCLVGASAHSKRRMIVIGMITSLYLSLRYGPRSLFAMDQIKFTSVETSTGESSHIASIICLSAICRLPHFSLSNSRLLPRLFSISQSYVSHNQDFSVRTASQISPMSQFK